MPTLEWMNQFFVEDREGKVMYATVSAIKEYRVEHSVGLSPAKDKILAARKFCGI